MYKNLKTKSRFLDPAKLISDIAVGDFLFVTHFGIPTIVGIADISAFENDVNLRMYNVCIYDATAHYIEYEYADYFFHIDSENINIIDKIDTPLQKSKTPADIFNALKHKYPEYFL